MKQERTRLLQILMFSVGTGWALLDIISGQFMRPDVLIAFIIEAFLLYLSFFDRKLKDRELLGFLTLTLIYILVSVFTGLF